MELKEEEIMRWRGVVYGPDSVETRFQIESEPGAESGDLIRLELTANFAHARMSDELVREILTPTLNGYRKVRFIDAETFESYTIDSEFAQ